MSRLVSPTQRKVLEALEAGGTITLCRHSGRDLSDTAALFPKKGPPLRISTATVEALRLQGWLIDTEDAGYRWRGSRYVISGAGVNALRDEQFASQPGKPISKMTPENWKSFEDNLKRKAKQDAQSNPRKKK